MSDTINQVEDKEGIVIESLPEAMFKILLNDQQEIIAYLSGKMRLGKIKVIIGDKVLVKVDKYGGKGRIFKRL